MEELAQKAWRRADRRPIKDGPWLGGTREAFGGDKGKA